MVASGLADSRRSNKPIMEKRRRARINHCLNELKTLILSSGQKETCRHSKLEKADILEMAVGHVERLQRTDRFQEGWRQCLGEVAGFSGLHPQVKKNLLRHLSSRMMTSTGDAVDLGEDRTEAGGESVPPMEANARPPVPWSPLARSSQEHWRPW